MKKRPAIAAIAALAVLMVSFVVLIGWLNDFVTLHGAKTVYTAACVKGEWRGRVCTGTMQAGDRYRYRALKPHREVVFWVAGSTEPSGKLVDCTIDNAKEWSCKTGVDSRRTITHQMKFGHPVPEPKGPALPFHPVAKWKWLLLDAGLSSFHEADL